MIITLPDEDGDHYLVDGRPVRRWHTVLREAGLQPPIPDNPGAHRNMIFAKHRGKQIHQACAMLIRGQPFDIRDLADESLPFIQAFLKFWDKHGVRDVEVETALYNAELDYCTTPDFHTRVSVNDIKTGDRPSRTWGLQLAAQQLALQGHLRRIIWLRPKLKRQFEILEPDDPRVFTAYDFDVVREAALGLVDGPAIRAWKGEGKEAA